MTPRFRPTVWPGGVVPVPPVPLSEPVEELGDGWLLLGEAEHEVELPVDFYLREPDQVDVDEPRSLVDFVRAWGRCSHEWYGDMPAGELYRGLVVEPVALRLGWLPRRRGELFPRLVSEASDIGERLGMNTETSVEWRARLVHVVEVRARLVVLRQLAKHMRRWQENEDLELVWASADKPPWQMFANYLNPALSTFQVHIEPMEPTMPTVTAYSAAALQLVNDLANEAAYHRCANERCGRLFTRQRGRAEYGEYRTAGVRFCSRECARAQAERERRRRQRKERQA